MSRESPKGEAEIAKLVTQLKTQYKKIMIRISLIHILITLFGCGADAGDGFPQ